MALDHITYELLHSRMQAWHAEEMRCKYAGPTTAFQSVLLRLLIPVGPKTSCLCRLECTILLVPSKITPTTRNF
jgi:hypothetical protein